MKIQPKIHVNLGCGKNIVPDTKEEKWINIDSFLVTDAPNFKEGDAKNIPLENDSVDYLLCDQVLEHISMKDIPPVLHEIRRVLKQGGKGVIVVPDFRDAAEQWLRLDHNVGYNPYSYNYLSEVIYGNQNHEGEYHKTPFSAGFLNYSLNMVGLYPKAIIFYPANGPLPKYPGIRYSDKAMLRNAQLVAEFIKF